MSNVKWSEYVEVKGRVKLHDFVKYIQELRCSRKKWLMVWKYCCSIYLFTKISSSCWLII